MPIYVGFESSDVWENKNLFELNENNGIKFQSGCPPCGYNKNGQLWGNPVYNWKIHKKSDYQWWVSRFKKLYEMVDVVRLDHFIGFSRFWAIPGYQKTARFGKWEEGPGIDFFEEINKKIENLKIIAEDLGDITEDVIKLRNRLNFPGMKIIQFEFEDCNFNKEFSENSVLYTGTHDNDTLKGWINSLPNTSSVNNLCREKLKNEFISDDTGWDIIKFVLQSKSKWVIFPLQDILNLGSNSRFNYPGTLSKKNWRWRFKENQLNKNIKNKMKEILIKCDRIAIKFNEQNPNKKK